MRLIRECGRKPVRDVLQICLKLVGCGEARILIRYLFLGSIAALGDGPGRHLRGYRVRFTTAASLVHELMKPTTKKDFSVFNSSWPALSC